MAEAETRSKYRQRLDREREEGKREGSLDARERALHNSRNASGPRKSSGGGKGSSGIQKIGRGFLANSQGALLAEQTVTVVAIAAYDLQQKASGRKLPAPGPIVAAFGFYSILSLVGSFGEQAARTVSLIGAVSTVTVVVTGARGKSLLELVAKLTSYANLGGGQGAAPGSGYVAPSVGPVLGWDMSLANRPATG